MSLPYISWLVGLVDRLVSIDHHGVRVPALVALLPPRQARTLVACRRHR
jgi:hypothetical protein